jgi:hypothetical protein
MPTIKEGQIMSVTCPHLLCWQTVLAGNKVAHRETVPAQIMKFGAMLLH